MKRIAIVGAGAGGTMSANLLAKDLHDEVKNEQISIDLIGMGPNNIFDPANLDVAFKGRDPGGSVKDETSLLRREVKFNPVSAAAIDLENRKVGLTDRDTLDFDYIILATGALPVPESMPGLKESSLNFHTSPHDASKIWDALNSFKSGKIVVAITSVPYKCPPSPNEAAFMIDEHFRKRGIRKDVEIKLLTPYPRAYPSETISKVVQALYDERGIETIPFFNVDHVEPAAKKVVSIEGDEVDFDLLIAVPPHKGAQVIRESHLGDEDGWIPADKQTMKMKGHSEAYALGDATNIPISKSGVVAHLQSKVVAHNLLSDLQGTSEIMEYNGRINCSMETGNRRALFVAATYSTPPAKQRPTFIRYMMKKGFASMYWSVLQDKWDWIFSLYFGKTSTIEQRERIATVADTVPA